MGQIEQSLAEIRVRKRYLGTAMYGPHFQKILAISGAISQRPSRTSFLALIAANQVLFLTTFAIFFQRGYKMGHIEQSLSAIRVWKRAP